MGCRMWDGTGWYPKCPLASWGGRETGIGKFDTQHDSWPESETRNRDMGHGMGQVGTQQIPQPQVGTWRNWDAGDEADDGPVWY